MNKAIAHLESAIKELKTNEGENSENVEVPDDLSYKIADLEFEAKSL